MANKIQFRRDTASNWTSANPTLSQGELGFETDTNKFKLGTGSTAWNSLSYTFNPSITANQDLNTTSNVTFNNVDVSSQISINRLAKLGAGLSNIEIAEDDNLTPQTDLRSDLGISGKRFGNAYINTTTVGAKIVFPDASQQTTAWTGSVSTSSVSGLSVVGYTNNYNDLSNKPTIASYDQSLNTTNNVQFVNVVATGGLKASTGTQAGQTISAGGFPLDSAGQALIGVSNTQSVAMVVSNYNSNILARLYVRGYGQNTPGGGATTAGNGQLLLEGSRGTGASPTATGSGDNLGAVNFGGYDGTNWLSSQAGSVSTLPPASIFVNAAEAFANNGTTTTNAGTTMFMRLQPVATQLNTTSRRNWFVSSWTAGSTATNSPPILNLSIGQGADGTNPTLTPASGVGSFGTGSGRIGWQWNGVSQGIVGVPSQDTAPDNATLTATNVVTFISGRRSSVSGRRNALATGDTVGQFNFNAQTAASQTGNGSTVASMSVSMVEAAGASARGTRFTLQTVNTGTTTLSSRLILDDRLNQICSDSNVFTDKTGSFTALNLTTSSAAFGSGVVISGYKKCFGDFLNTGTTTFTANTGTAIALTNDTVSNCTVQSGSQILISQAGDYNLQFSAQIENANNQEHDAWFWIRKNGVDVAQSATKYTVIKSGASVAALTFNISSNGTDYYEIVCAVNSTNLTLPSYAADSQGFPSPAIPAVIVNLIPIGA
jgi:hypothetical protein